MMSEVVVWCLLGKAGGGVEGKELGTLRRAGTEGCWPKRTGMHGEGVTPLGMWLGTSAKPQREGRE